MALIGALAPGFRPAVAADAAALAGGVGRLPDHDQLIAAVAGARHVYVIGRDTGFGAAAEVALKIKETCAIHAEAYSASEVLHGPLQLATRGLTILMLDTGAAVTQPSLDLAEARLTAAGARVWRVRAPSGLTGAGAAAALLMALYPVIWQVALTTGHDPDAPATLSKVTRTT
jgi:glucosamine--fructose-6-phosphate aminotransferase (isomerizing)